MRVVCFARRAIDPSAPSLQEAGEASHPSSGPARLSSRAVRRPTRRSDRSCRQAAGAPARWTPGHVSRPPGPTRRPDRARHVRFPRLDPLTASSPSTLRKHRDNRGDTRHNNERGYASDQRARDVWLRLARTVLALPASGGRDVLKIATKIDLNGRITGLQDV